jgi:hypothetical protein
MRYTCYGFQQTELVKNKLDNDDALLLRTLKGMYSSAKMELITKNGERYMWITYDYLLEEIFIIGSKSTLKRKIAELVDKGFLKKVVTHYRKGRLGKYLYVALTDLVDQLEKYEPTQESKRPDIKGQNEPSLKGQNDTSLKGQNDPSKIINIKDPNITDHTTTTEYINDNNTDSFTDVDCNEENIYSISKTEQIEEYNPILTERPEKTDKKDTKQIENNQEKQLNNNLADVDEVKDMIETVIKAKISRNKLRELLKSHGREKIEYYLDNWYKFDGTHKNNIAGFFICAIEGNWEFPQSYVVKQSSKPIQATNYYQREYTDEEYEAMYDNLA